MTYNDGNLDIKTVTAKTKQLIRVRSIYCSHRMTTENLMLYFKHCLMEPVYMQHTLAFYLHLLHFFNCYHFIALCK